LCLEYRALRNSTTPDVNRELASHVNTQGTSREDQSRSIRYLLSDGEEFNKDEKRILDALTQGLSREFPNPERVGCPGLAVLRGIAFRKLRVAEVDQWLAHLSSCSPCYQEFTELRKEVASQRRRTQAWIAVAAVLIFAVAGWLWVRTHQPVRPSETAVLDLRGLSATRGENPTQTNQPPLELPRTTKHLIMDLPIGSNEGTYDLALLSPSGTQVLSTSGAAQLQNQVVVLRADVNASKVPPGTYFFAIRQPGLKWARYPIRVF
jgi:hypothetical protein